MSAETGVQKSPMINSDCKAVATDDDFLKLRKKMVTKDDDDEMIFLHNFPSNNINFTFSIPATAMESVISPLSTI